MESQIYFAKPLRWSAGPGLSSCGTGIGHRLGRPHPQTLEPPEDSSCQKVSDGFAFCENALVVLINSYITKWFNLFFHMFCLTNTTKHHVLSVIAEVPLLMWSLYTPLEGTCEYWLHELYYVCVFYVVLGSCIGKSLHQTLLCHIISPSNLIIDIMCSERFWHLLSSHHPSECDMLFIILQNVFPLFSVPVGSEHNSQKRVVMSVI